MKYAYPNFPGWTFDVSEYSIGVYEVMATNDQGVIYKAHGGEPADVIELCKKLILQGKKI